MLRLHLALLQSMLRLHLDRIPLHEEKEDEPDADLRFYRALT